MANQQQLDIFKQGVEVWNQWRVNHLEAEINLKEVDLNHAVLSSVKLNRANLNFAHLSGANLQGADLFGVSLVGAELGGADLRGANLNRANLADVNLEEANLEGADLTAAILMYAGLSGANLTRADLSNANFTHANLSNADLTDAGICSTNFASVDLRNIKGLAKVQHRGPSEVSIRTIYYSQGDIPEEFLRGAGVDDTFITYMRSLVGKAIEYYSCFISYSSKDEAFARRLYADLQRHNVRCWFAPEDLKWGGRIRSGIDEGIRLHDKLLLILSRQSLASGWVEREVKAALTKERKEKRTVLFPVRVDKAIFESPYAWATEIRHERSIGDFTRWKDHDAYEKAFSRLLRDLRAES